MHQVLCRVGFEIKLRVEDGLCGAKSACQTTSTRGPLRNTTRAASNEAAQISVRKLRATSFR
jgi:hypothetical protein